MTVKFMSLASGSSGNCYYLATDNTAILVDAGIGIRTIKKVFKERMLNLEGIQAVLVTHDHADHIKAVGHLGEKHGIPVYTTPEIHEGMKHSYCMTERLSPERTRFIRKEETFSVGDFTITTKLENPVHFRKDISKAVEAGSDANLLGTRWLGLSVVGYGIHGHAVPEDLGKQVSLGCVRMLNKDVEELYDILPMKTKVTIVD